MAYLPKRRKIRNPYHDYSKPCSYFITIDIKLGQCLFGKAISKTEIGLNPLGKIAESFWLAIPLHFPHVLLGEFIVMPNHIHGIVHVKSPIVTNSGNIDLPINYITSGFSNYNQFGPLRKGSLSVILGQFKASVTRWANKNNLGGLFDWHELFYDRIIKDKDALMLAEKYIQHNPPKWWIKYSDKQW